MNRSTPGLPVHHQLLEFTQTHVHWVGDAIQPSHPLSSPSPSAFIFPSIRVFSNESALRIRWPEYWSFSFSISPSNEYSVFVSYRIDPLLFRGFFSSTTVWKHQFFGAQLLNGPTFTSVHDHWKTIDLTIWTFVSKVMSLFLNTLSKFDRAFLLRSKHFFILWLQSPSTEIYGAQENKICPFFYFFPNYFAWNDGNRCHDPRFWNTEFYPSFFTLLFHNNYYDYHNSHLYQA